MFQRLPNGGKLYKPSFMKSIREVNSDEVIETGGGVLKSVLPAKMHLI